MATPSKEKTVEEVAMGTLGAVVMTDQVDMSPAIATQFDDWDDDVVSTASDFIIPQLQLMQGTTELVKEGKASPGEYADNLGNILADRNTELEVIVVKRDKYWTETEIDEDGRRIKGGIFRKVPFTLDNEKLPWNFLEDGKTMKRTLTYDFFVIVANEDGEKVFAQLPKVFSLSSTASKVAREWYTKFTNLKTQKKSPVSVVFKLGRRLEKNNKGDTWVFPTLAIGRNTTQAEQECAAYWRSEFVKKEIKVHGEEA
jgi:hypothetical protein